MNLTDDPRDFLQLRGHRVGVAPDHADGAAGAGHFQTGDADFGCCGFGAHGHLGDQG